MTAPSICLVGAGGAGSSFILALHRAGYPIAGVASRSLDSAQRCAQRVDCRTFGTRAETLTPCADVVIIATPDAAITPVCEHLRRHGGLNAGQVVIHLSGALGSDALQAARLAKAHALSLHPVQTLVDPEQGAHSLRGSYFALEGDAPALALGKSLVSALSGHALVIPKARKPLYHAALCVASNYLVSLADMARQMLEEAGIEPEQALPLMLPLMHGALDNLHQNGLPDALTGPISRGDAGTLAKHLAILEQTVPDLLDSYRELGRQTERLAWQQGRQDAEGKVLLHALLAQPDKATTGN